MIHATKAIVLRAVKYAETSMVVTAYTEKFGMQAYLVNRVRSSRSKMQQSLFQPLSLVDMIAYHREQKNLQRIKELRFDYLFKTLPFDIQKSTIAIFLQEVLLRSLKEEEPNARAFGFLHDSIVLLDETRESVADFHLWFLAQFSAVLGFFPSGTYSLVTPYFNIHSGTFCETGTSGASLIKPPESEYFSMLIWADHFPVNGLKMHREARNRLLDHLLAYYAYHLEGFGKLRSPAVLQTIFD